MAAAGLTGLASAGLALARPRSLVASVDRASQEPLAKLCAAIAPGTAALPGAMALKVDRRVAPMLAALRPEARADVDALLRSVAQLPSVGDVELAQLGQTHGRALRLVAAQVFRVLYGSTRHDGCGAAGTFGALDYL